MFGNKFSGDEIAKEFYQKMNPVKKEASDKTAELKPEDFLVAPAEDSSVVGDTELSTQIDSVSSYAEDTQVSLADDKVCKVCDADDCKCCKDCQKSPCECEAESEASDFFLNSNAKYVLQQLGKMSGKLRLENHAFAADMVEATAMSIKDDLVKEAAEKLEIITSLKKMAKSVRTKGDAFTGDLIDATIEEIKKG